MKVRAFITHKKAEHFQDCQDRFSVNCDTKSLALSDGMSQSIFQTIWAELLVNAYTKDDNWKPNAEKDLNTVKNILAGEWRKRVQDRIQQMQKLGKNTTRTENSLAIGLSAGATLVGIRFEENEWCGDVLGDSCLVEIQDSQINKIYTSQDDETFDNNPDYFDSNPLKEGKGEAKTMSGKLSPGMTILLVSDPFSDFLSEKKKQGMESQFVKEILELHTHEDFEDLVFRWRSEYGMHNDDSTLIIIEWNESNDLNVVCEDDIEKLIAKEQPENNNEQSPNNSQTGVTSPITGKEYLNTGEKQNEPKQFDDTPKNEISQLREELKQSKANISKLAEELKQSQCKISQLENELKKANQKKLYDYKKILSQIKKR